MKLKFKDQQYQTCAVEDVADCFKGQPKISGQSYRIDTGPVVRGQQLRQAGDDEGFRNAELALSDAQILDNIRAVQRRRNLPLSQSLRDFTAADGKGGRAPAKKSYAKKALAAARVHLDVEMETGTGKTYCYIKTIFETHERYGWSKFIIMAPSIAIREGVHKSLEITAEHFAESYAKKARFFIYDSKRLHELDNFSSDAGISVMVINIQAFNARGADNRRIYDELDDFQSRRPIDVIAANRPILILDEPQKMEGDATLDALPKFKPLFILRYSATHRTWHNRIHRLDALDAYNQKLVKKIAVRGIRTLGLPGAKAYLYLEGIDVSKQAPVARVEMQVKPKSGEVVRKLLKLKYRDDLFAKSGGLEAYRGFTVSQIDAFENTVEFTNGEILRVGEANGDVSEDDIRRIQIRETAKAHLDKERQLFDKRVKVLSLFFIDEVKKYRDYGREDEKGEYARIFEEEYEQLKDEYLSELPLEPAYHKHLESIDASATHKGYFSIDKKTNRLKDPSQKKSADSDDIDAYDLILKDKERLLSFEEPTRFIFSHSALREGWDNPNVFVMCMLKHSDNTISRRQEVGRGLRLSVDQRGERMDGAAEVHEVNVLTVVASESYSDFVAGLQEEIVETLSARPRKADVEYFTGKMIDSEDGPLEVTSPMARQIYRYLLKNDYSDDDDGITDAYHEDKREGQLAELPAELKPHAEQVFKLIDSVFSEAQLTLPEDARKSPTNRLNDNFERKEFQQLWQRINRKAFYRVKFDSNELIRKCVAELDAQLRVTPLQYKIVSGEQSEDLTEAHLQSGEGFKITQTRSEYGASVHSPVKYDLIDNIVDNTDLTRKTSAMILSKIAPEKFAMFKQNPEQFISEVSRIVNEQKATAMIEHLTYDIHEEEHSVGIFTENQTIPHFSRMTEKLKKHIYDYAATDSKVEKNFVEQLEHSEEVVVYAKLPSGFKIPTPVGDYNPDWAISFTEGSVRHIYFVAETKGSMSSMQLRGIEQNKIECARKFFDALAQQITTHRVKYDVVTNYAALINLVKHPSP